MIHPYQLHSLGKIYREEAMQEARVRNLAHRAKSHRRPRSEERGALVLDRQASRHWRSLVSRFRHVRRTAIRECSIVKVDESESEVISKLES